MNSGQWFDDQVRISVFRVGHQGKDPRFGFDPVETRYGIYLDHSQVYIGHVPDTLTDLQTDASLSRGMWYTVPIVATADDIRKIVSVSLLVNAQKVYLPIVE